MTNFTDRVILKLNNTAPDIDPLEITRKIWWFEDGMWAPRGFNLQNVQSYLTLTEQNNDPPSEPNTNLFEITAAGTSEPPPHEPLLVTDRGFIGKKDIAAGGFLSSNQGELWLGSGRNDQIDVPKIVLGHSDIHRLNGGGSLDAEPVPTLPYYPAQVNGRLFIYTADYHLYKYITGIGWVDKGPSSDYSGYFDTLFLTKADASTPAGMDLGDLTAHGNLTALGGGGFIAKPSSGTSNWSFQGFESGKTYPRFIIQNDGTIRWGNGTSPVDTDLYRFPGESGLLKTDGNFEIAKQLRLYSDMGEEPHLDISNPSGDGGALASIALRTSGWDVRLGTEKNNWYLALYDNEYIPLHGWTDKEYKIKNDQAAIFFGSTHDVKLYRPNIADTLKTDDNFIVEGNLTISKTASTQLTCGITWLPSDLSGGEISLAQGTSQAGKFLPYLLMRPKNSDMWGLWLINAQAGEDSGSVPLAEIRGAINGGTVSTRPLFRVTNNGSDRLLVSAAGQLQLNTQGLTGGIVVGGDVNLYRSATDTLKTDDNLVVAGEFTHITGISRSDESYGFRFLTLSSAAQTVKAKSVLLSTSYADPAPNDAGIQFGSDVNLYRSAPNLLKTEDNFQAGGYSSNDGTAGVTEDVTVVTAIGPPPVTATLHFKNGIYVGKT